MKHSALLVLFVLAVPLTGCGDRDPRLEEWNPLSQPWFIGDQVVYHDTAFDELLVLEARREQSSLTYRRIPIPEGSTRWVTLDKSGKLLLRQAEDNLITLVDLSAGTMEELEIASPYDRIEASEDANAIAMYFSENATGNDANPFLNKAEVSFLDLAATPPKVVRRVIPTYGGAPLGVQLAPPVMASGKTRRLAFVRWNSSLSVVDVDKPDAAPVEIRLKTPDSSNTVVPGNLQFYVEEGVLRVLFIAGGTNDLYMVEIDVANFASGGAGVLLNLFPTASGAEVFAPYEDRDGKLAVIVLCRTGHSVAVVHPDSSEVELYALDIAPRHLLLTSLTMEDSGIMENVAVVADVQGGAQTYYIVQLDRLVEKKSKALLRFSVPSPLSNLWLLGDGRHALAFHAYGSSSLSQVDLESGSVVSLGYSMEIRAQQMDAAMRTLYAVGVQNGKSYLVSIDAISLEVNSVRLPGNQPPSALHLLEDEDLIVLSDSDGELLWISPLQPEAPEEIVEFVLPSLTGLEH